MEAWARIKQVFHMHKSAKSNSDFSGDIFLKQHICVIDDRVIGSQKEPSVVHKNKNTVFYVLRPEPFGGTSVLLFERRFPFIYTIDSTTFIHIYDHDLRRTL